MNVLHDGNFSMTIEIEKQDRVFTIIINHPEVRNAIDRPNADHLADAFRQFESDADSDVAVLYGNGGNFCAGADLKAITDPDRVHRFEETGDAPMGPSRMCLSKPVIAAVSGYAVAGGLELAVFCDLRIVEKSAVLGVFCRRWGVPLIDGGTIRLPRLIGLSRALDMILTGRPVYSDEALAMGLANRVVEDGTCRAEAEKMAKQLSRFPQTCMRNDRLSACEQFSMTLEDALANEYQHGVKSINSPELVDGLEKFTKGKGRHGTFDDKG
ncbi:MAG: crotonase/enoyl-CoA hydratase family protein [Desulfobacteraceae bacterium]|nr:crotonase/enoyl-CoA hydratase family protein [Desulfobacteraceae bacterium]